MSTATPTRLRALIVSATPSPDRTRILQSGAQAAGCDIVATLAAGAPLASPVAQLRPELIVIDAPDHASALLAQIMAALGPQRVPIVVFTDDQGRDSMDAAIAAGVSAYVVDGLHAGRVASVLQVAMARFRQEQKLIAELEAARLQLAERKIIERAKGLLMASQRLSEDQAYQKLRSMAMNKNLKLAEIAQRILDVGDLLG